MPTIIQDDIITAFERYDCFKRDSVALTFLDPPFNQGKEYALHDDKQEELEYWNWIKKVLHKIKNVTMTGGAIYFMHREKNLNHVLSSLWMEGWDTRNIIIWKKKSSAVPMATNYGLAYQPIVYAVKGWGAKPHVFNKLRIDPPLLVTEKYERPNGMYVTNVWDDIRELTSGYFAGNEPLKKEDGTRAHKQQAPVDLLLRIILTSSKPGDLIFDPFAGTGTTAVVATQLDRESINVEIDPENVALITDRLEDFREIDNLAYRYEQYKYTANLAEIWGQGSVAPMRQLPLLEKA